MGINDISWGISLVWLPAPKLNTELSKKLLGPEHASVVPVEVSTGVQNASH